MKVMLAAIAGRASGEGFNDLAKMYAKRLASYVAMERRDFPSEESFLKTVEGLRARTAPFPVLLDSRGKAFSSEELAAWIGARRDDGTQTLVFAVGPADGWSAATLKAVHSRPGTSGFLLSLSPMTLPHELAQVVLAEQVYRAFTILAGHPYHLGH